MKSVLRFGTVVCAGLVLAVTAHAQQVKPTVSIDDLTNKLTPGTSCSDPSGDCSASKKAGHVQGFNIGGMHAAPSGKSTAAPSHHSGHHAAATTASTPVDHKADLMLSFEKNSSELTAQGKANADVFAQFLSSDRAKPFRYEIGGHTDAKGGKTYNMSLSQRRAQAVRDYLVSHGVDGAKLETKGYGYSRPIPGDKPSDPNNRRVEATCLNCTAA